MLRERTLQHLLLVTAKAISEQNENSSLTSLINETCKSLEVSKERGAAYVIHWRSGGKQKSIEVDSSAFQFHIRGDQRNLESKMDGTIDARTRNWHSAIETWRRIVPIDFESPNTLAPKYIKVGFRGVDTTRIIVSIATCAVVVFLARSSDQLWPLILLTSVLVPLVGPSKANVMLGGFVLLCALHFGHPLEGALLIPLMLWAFHLGEVLFSDKGYFCLSLLLVALSFWDRISMPSMVSLLVLETMSAAIGRTYSRIALLGGMTGLLLIFALQSEWEFRGDLLPGVAFLTIVVFLITLALPQHTSVGLIRISIPVATAVHFFTSGDILLFLLPITWIGMFLIGSRGKRPNSEPLGANNLKAIPVTVVRKNRVS